MPKFDIQKMWEESGFCYYRQVEAESLEEAIRMVDDGEVVEDEKEQTHGEEWGAEEME